MRLPIFILILLALEPSSAENEEQFEWMGINFCTTTVETALELFPETTYHGDIDILEVAHLGETLGGEYDELYFYVRPDGVIIGVQISIASGDFREMELEIDILAANRWGERFSKDEHKHGEDSHDVISWSGWGEETGISMSLHSSESSPLYKTGLSKDGKRTIAIGLKSSTSCDRWKEYGS